MLYIIVGVISMILSVVGEEFARTRLLRGQPVSTQPMDPPQAAFMRVEQLVLIWFVTWIFLNFLIGLILSPIVPDYSVSEQLASFMTLQWYIFLIYGIVGLVTFVLCRLLIFKSS